MKPETEQHTNCRRWWGARWGVFFNLKHRIQLVVLDTSRIGDFSYVLSEITRARNGHNIVVVRCCDKVQLGGCWGLCEPVWMDVSRLGMCGSNEYQPIQLH